MGEPIERVFEVASDFRGPADTVGAIERVELLTEGPTGLGTRFRETRKVFGREATEEMEITAFDAPHAYTVASVSCGCEFDWVFRFIQEGHEGKATIVEFEMHSRPVTFFAKVTSPLARLMAPMMKKCFDKDFEELRIVAESAGTSVAAAS